MLEDGTCTPLLTCSAAPARQTSILHHAAVLATELDRNVRASHSLSRRQFFAFSTYPFHPLVQGKAPVTLALERSWDGWDAKKDGLSLVAAPCVHVRRTATRCNHLTLTMSPPQLSCRQIMGQGSFFFAQSLAARYVDELKPSCWSSCNEACSVVACHVSGLTSAALVLIQEHGVFGWA